MAIQSDGKILIAGTATASYSELVLARFSDAGVLDLGFGTNGIVIAGGAPNTQETPAGLAIQADGKIVVGANVLNESSPNPYATCGMLLLRLNSDGSFDRSFGNAGELQLSFNLDPLVAGFCHDLTILGNGEIVVAGGTSNSQELLEWLKSDGTAIAQDQSIGGLGSIDELIAMPQGGVEAIGSVPMQSGGFAVEYHAAPGSASGLFQDNMDVPSYSLDDATLTQDGKIIVSVNLPPYDSYTSGVELVRLSDPGLTSSPNTLVQWMPASDLPSGRMLLEAQVIPQLGTAPVIDGTLVFKEGSQVLGTVNLAPTVGGLNPAGPPSITVSLPAGQHTITAVYSGSSHWNGSNSDTSVYSFGPVQQSVNASLTVSDSSPYRGESIDLTTTVTDSQGTAFTTGAVTFFDGSTAIGTVTLDSTGTAVDTLDTSTMTVGVHDFHAVYGGSALPGGFPSATTSLIPVYLNPAPVDVALTTSTSSPVSGAPVILTAAVQVQTNPAIAPGGTVAFMDGATQLGSASVNAHGLAQLKIVLGLGSHTIKVNFTGDSQTGNAAAAPLHLTVGPAPTTTSLAVSAVSVTPNQAVTLTATVQPQFGAAFPIGSVTFRDGATIVGSASVDGRGQAKLTLTQIAPGNHSFTASFAGCSTCLPSASAAVVVKSVGIASTSVALSLSANNLVYGESVKLTAQVAASTGGTPTGTITFYDGTSVLGAVPLNNGFAAMTITPNLGAHKFKAVYSGSSAALGSTSASLAEIVAKAPTTVVLSLLLNGTDLSAKVSPAYSGSPIGSVTFKNGNTVIGTALVNGAGLASLQLPKPLASGVLITAIYSGCSCFLGSASSAEDPL
jgi:uncharacterized delta-60 repeat protein